MHRTDKTNDMNWLEIISVKAAGSIERTRVIEICSKIRIPRMNGKSARMLVYGNSINNELTIHIYWSSPSAPEGKSPLGRAMSRTISDLGLVSHTVWVECA